MLINATRAGQLRVAIVDGTILQEYQVETTEAHLCRGNIYRGIVANIQPSLNAAFIDIGEERHGFLPVADVQTAAYHKKPDKNIRRPRIDQVLERGKPILVQVTKDGVGQKGPALNTNIALAGRYLVLTPFDDVRGISRKAEGDDARKTIRGRLKKLSLPEGHGVIVRTNGLEQNQTTLNRDLSALLRLWRRVRTEGSKGKGPILIYSDQDLVVQSLRDYLDPQIAQVIVDSDVVEEKAKAYMQAFMPRSKTKLIRYNDRLPLFSRYRLETQIDRIYDRSASLPGGGSIVIDPTEALTAVDVNSGRATKNANHDESILAVNIEAAEEVARQLRLRDIGGLVVVDFIDMRLRKHQNKLEKVVRDAMKVDKARYSVGRISTNGLLEINRQRIKQALRLRTHRTCPTCLGASSIPTTEFACLGLLSRIEAKASTGLMKLVTLAVHPEIADAVQNNHRQEIAAMELDLGIRIEIISAPHLGRNEERVDWIQRDASEVPAVIKTAALTATDLGKPPDRGEVEYEDSEARGKKRRRRRRRGGSKGEATTEATAKDAAAKNTAAKNTAAKNTAAKDSADSSHKAKGEDREDSKRDARPKPRRRRRRGGRRRRSEGVAVDTETSAETTSVETTAAEAIPTDAKTGAAVAAGDAKDSSSRGARGSEKPARRRRRSTTRRRRSAAPRKESDTGHSADLDDAADQPEQTVQADHAKAAEAAAANAVAEAAAADGVAQEAAADAAPDPDDAAKPAKPRARRTRSRSRKRKPAAADSEGSTESASGNKSDADTSAKEEAKPAKPARKRVRKTAKTAKAAVKTPAVETPAVEAPDAIAVGKVKSKQPPSNESALHHTSEAPDDQLPPRQSTEPVPDRGLSKHLRWQWWGGDGEQPSSNGDPVEEKKPKRRTRAAKKRAEPSPEPLAETPSASEPDSSD